VTKTAVRKVEQIWVDLPLKETPQYYLAPHWDVNFSSVRTLCKVTLENGVVGFGEGIIDETGERRVAGRDAAEWMWDDSVGGGLQMALFDAVGRAREVPIHRLLGRKCREHAALSWWAGAMPARAWVSECKEAVSLGYRSFKAKARPWFDLVEQCEVLTKALPDEFLIGFDFNCSLRDPRRAAGYLAEVQRYPAVSILESPIPEGDLAGNRFLRTQTRVPIAMHHRHPPIEIALREEVCDGFVIGGGVREVMQYGALCADADKPFWLQMPGSGITAVFCLHLSAVLTHAVWPSVNLNHLFSEQLVRPGIRLEDGSAPIPDGPGLGFEIDEAAVECCRVAGPPRASEARSDHLLAIRWASGQTTYYASARDMKADFDAGLLPTFSRGVYLEVIPNDGRREWQDFRKRAGIEGALAGGC
jgi:L-alanine-DL-glutamate epimerase-like enolase superfamily enzyme